MATCEPFPKREEATLSLVVAGHIDHGKSTTVGRLLADAGLLPDGKVEQIRKYCEAAGRPFEYAYVLDALKDEQLKGITIDAARVFFATAFRRYQLIDAPGHKEFLRNMVTGAARADAALLVVSASEGLRENSRRHATMLSFLGVKQLAVIVNKMDLVDYSAARFEELRREIMGLASSLGFTLGQADVIPVSAYRGENLASRSPLLGWFDGPTLLERIDAFSAPLAAEDQPLRLPVQDVYRFDGSQPFVVGTIVSGALAPGQEIEFRPSGARAFVRKIKGGASAGFATALTLDPESPVGVGRGEVAVLATEVELAGIRPVRRMRAVLFWLGTSTLRPGTELMLRAHTARSFFRLTQINRVIDPGTLAVCEAPDGNPCVESHQIAEAWLETETPLALSLAEESPETGRFVLLEPRDASWEICGGGRVLEAPV